MKTSELKGAALDWAVAKCEIALQLEKTSSTYPDKNIILGKETDYSTDWALGGPIIEREFIAVSSPRGFGWVAELWQEEINPITGHFTFSSGDTPLIAAMRCYVASKLGNEVEIPEELT